MREFLDKVKKNIEYLECHLGYQDELEELAQQEVPTEKLAEASGEENYHVKETVNQCLPIAVGLKVSYSES